jgi:hypothetical protein
MAYSSEVRVGNFFLELFVSGTETMAFVDLIVALAAQEKDPGILLGLDSASTISLPRADLIATLRHN